MMQEIAYAVHAFKEDGTYIACVPELDVSSCGSTNDETRKNIRDAVRSFLEASADKASLDGILEEAGYRRRAGHWEAPEFVALDRETASVRRCLRFVPSTPQLLRQFLRRMAFGSIGSGETIFFRLTLVSRARS